MTPSIARPQIAVCVLSLTTVAVMEPAPAKDSRAGAGSMTATVVGESTQRRFAAGRLRVS